MFQKCYVIKIISKYDIPSPYSWLESDFCESDFLVNFEKFILMIMTQISLTHITLSPCMLNNLILGFISLGDPNYQQ